MDLVYELNKLNEEKNYIEFEKDKKNQLKKSK